MSNPRAWMGALTVLFLVSSVVSGYTQGFRWPEEPENLEVLPSTVKGRELGGLMRDFATSLGVRCQHCHAAREGQELDPSDLTSFDFASDENPMKEKARTMIRMVRAINETHLSKLDVPASERLQVSCITCHHGLSRPQPLGDLLTGVIEEDRVEAAVARYHELWEQHYGSAAYDFSPGVLSRIGESLIGEERLDEAIRVLTLENEQHPDFAYGHFLRATAHEKAGDMDAALEHMQKAVDSAPADQRPFFAQALEKMKAR